MSEIAKTERPTRFNLIYYPRVFNRRTGELIGHIVDITTNGMKLISERQHKVNEEIDLKIELSPRLAGHEEISLNATSLWCKKSINTDFYDTGFKFNHPSDILIEIIDMFINEFRFNMDIPKEE